MTEPWPAARDYAGASLRDLTTRYLELLEVSVHTRLERRPMSADHALERLAVSEAISRYVRDGRQVDILAALNDGASWANVADVLDVPAAQLRAEFRRWVEGQRKLYGALQQERPGSAPIGLNREQAKAALWLEADAAGRLRAHRDRDVACQPEGTRVLPRPRDHLVALASIVFSLVVVNRHAVVGG